MVAEMNSALPFHLRKPFAQGSGTFCGDAELFQPVLPARTGGLDRSYQRGSTGPRRHPNASHTVSTPCGSWLSAAHSGPAFTLYARR